MCYLAIDVFSSDCFIDDAVYIDEFEDRRTFMTMSVEWSMAAIAFTVYLRIQRSSDGL